MFVDDVRRFSRKSQPTITSRIVLIVCKHVVESCQGGYSNKSSHISTSRAVYYLNHANASIACSCNQWTPFLLIAHMDRSGELVCVDLKDGLVSMLCCDMKDVVVVGILFRWARIIVIISNHVVEEL